MQTAANVLLPESGEGPFPVLYLLHGLSDDHTMWMRRSAIERHVEGYSADRRHAGWRTQFLQRRRRGLPVPDRAQRRAGGPRRSDVSDRRGARRALRRRVVDGRLRSDAVRPIASRPVRGGGQSFGRAVVGAPSAQPARETRTPTNGGGFWARPTSAVRTTCSRSRKRSMSRCDPALRVDCGVDDFLIESNREFDAHLTTIGYAHEYQEHPGGHTWQYWDEHIVESLAFFRRTMDF